MKSQPDKSKTIPDNHTNVLANQQAALKVAVLKQEEETLKDIRFYLLRKGNSYERQRLEERSQEVWQETVVEALRAAQNYDCKHPLRPWLRVIAVRLIQKSWRRNKLTSRYFLSEDELEKMITQQEKESNNRSQTKILEYLTARNEILKFLRQPMKAEEILGLLPNKSDRDVLRLRYIEDLHGADLATALGTSESAAQKRAARALNKLREVFQVAPK